MRLEINKLIEKYGDDFNWFNIDFENKYFVDEALKEINQHHQLYCKIKNSIAKCSSNDDVLFQLVDNSYAIIHLTYNICQSSEFPKYIHFSNTSEVENYLENSYIQRYM